MRVGIEKVLFLLGFFQLSGCSVDSAKSHYILAEKLWTDRKYSAAVTEFEKVTSKDPSGTLGQKALYRGATTQALFLSHYGDAIRKLRNYIQVSTDPVTVREAKIQIGELLFSKTEQYDQAIVHYQALLKENPKAPEAPEFLYRIGKSWFFLFQFDDALKTFSELRLQYPDSIWAEKAAFQIGTVHFTRGEDKAYQNAMTAYHSFIKAYPGSAQVPEAKFGVASCLEELDQLAQAYEAYSALKDVYPAPGVIQIKLARIKERMAQRNSK